MSQITATDLTREDLTMFSCVSFLKKTLSGIGEHSQRKSSIIQLCVHEYSDQRAI